MSDDGTDRYDVLQYALPEGIDPEEADFDQEVYAVPAGTGEDVVADHQGILDRQDWVRTAAIMAFAAAIMFGAVVLDQLLLGILLVLAIVVFDRIIRVMYMTVAPEVVASNVDRKTAVEQYGAEIADGDPFE